MVRTTAKGTRVTGAERDKLAGDLKRRYESGESIRVLARDTGRSYGFIHRILTESGVNLRGQGGEYRGAQRHGEEVAEPGPRPAEALHIVPDLPGWPVPPGAVAVPAEEYDRIRRRAIAELIRGRTERMRHGDFSDFERVSVQEIKSGWLDA